MTRDVTGIGRTRPSRRRPVGLFVAALAATEVGAAAEAQRYTATLRADYAGSGWVMNEAMPDHLDALAGWRAGRAGEAVVQLRVFRSPLSRHQALVEYQVRQSAAGARIRVAVCDTLRLAGEITAALARAGLPDPSVQIEVVERLPRPPSGKLRRFVPTDCGAS